MSEAPSRPHPVVFFDGDCAFCNRSIRWIMKRDRHDVLRFLPREAPEAPGILGPRADLLREDTLVYHDGTDPLVRSEAILAILGHLPAPWRWLTVFRLVPRKLRDAVYRFVARNRGRLARGKACSLPDDQPRQPPRP